MFRETASKQQGSIYCISSRNFLSCFHLDKSEAHPLVRIGVTVLQVIRRRLGLPSKNPSLGNESVPALSSCRMWTVCMINCLRYASYHADTRPLEPLMCRSQVRVPWGEWVSSTTDCNMKTTGSKQIRHYNVLKTTDSIQVAVTSHHPPLATSFIIYSISISNHVM
jgi:hypothetical protein